MIPESEKIPTDVARFLVDPGWFAVHPVTKGPPFSYSCGLWISTAHPELLSFWIPEKIPTDLLLRLAKMAKARPGAFWAGKIMSNPYEKGGKITFVDVPPEKYRSYTHYNNLLYRGGDRPYPVLQVVWSDPDGFFPWEEDYEEAQWPQPVLGGPYG